METTRFFVANLPSSTTERDLQKVFKDYGEITKVELKAKESAVEEDVKIIAFVTLRINSNDVRYCVDDLNWVKIHGCQIKVSVAKESFLDRLKREREEAEAAGSGEPAAATSHTEGGDEEDYEAKAPRREFLTQNLSNTRKTFSLDVDLDEDDISPDLLITKKRAASSMHNGRIVIQSQDTQPIHVIEKTHSKKPAPNKLLDSKSTTADQKRKESLNQKKNQYKENKSAIQQALSGMDAAPSKKIKFSDAEEDDEPEVAATKQTPSKKSKTNIFGSDNEEDAEETGLDLKPEYFGKKGEKLMQMQSKQSLDPRFKIDAKFVDDDEDEEVEDEGSETKGKSKKKPLPEVEEEGNERDWQMGILEQVVGSKVDTGNAAQKAARNKKMLRYDPSKDDHEKFLRTANAADSKEEKGKNAKKKDASNEAAEDNADAAPEVSKDVFYMVTDTLAESLKTRGDGFSLLNMFGDQAEMEERGDQLKKLSKEKILVNNKMGNAALNPFHYDSSSDSDNEMQITDAKDVESATKAGKTGKKKVKVLLETFFIPKNDPRLKEGAKFFKFAKKDVPEEQQYEEVRNRLKMLIKTKITKTKKNLLAHGTRVKNKHF